MATKKGAKKTMVKKKAKGRSFTPASRFLRYQITNSGTPGTETSHFIDLARDLSSVNRRLYRQGKVYQVANVTITSRNTKSGLASFGTAPDTWVSRGAWKRGFALYEHMNKKVLNLPGSASRKGRYQDFKVYLSDDHRTSANTPRPLDNGNNQASAGEWVYSQYTSPDGTTGADEFTAHLLGGHNGSAGSRNSVGLVYSYGESRATISIDNPLMDEDGSDDPLLNLFDAGTQVDEIAANLELDGDQAPYAIALSGNPDDTGEYYPGSTNNLPKPMVNRMTAIAASGWGAGPADYVAPTVTLPGFTAICGLIELEVQSSEANDVYDILIELAPGSYKGVAAFDI